MTEWSEDVLKSAHKHSAGHRQEIERSTVCGCFYCFSRFPPKEIEMWIDDDETTALCPRCPVDSVIGDASGFPVNDIEFLIAMHAYWFERSVPCLT